MRKAFHLAAVLILTTTAALAQEWSISGATGPFVFGKFVEKTTVVGTELGTSTITSRLSAATRPGIAADVERDFGRWLGVRFAGSWTYAPMEVKGSSGSVTFEAGHIGVTTLSVPLVINLNRGSFRFHLLGGPAYALYRGYQRASSGQSLAMFSGTRGRLGGVAGGGAAWWWSRRFAVEGEISDTVTASPFKLSDVGAPAKGVHIPKTQNVHTTVGIRYKF